MDKKNLGIYLIAASIVFASIIISQAIKSNFKNSCFNVIYEKLYNTKFKNEGKNKEIIVAAAANEACK